MTIGIGIIGTGSISDDAHAPAIKAVDGARLAAVLSRDALAGDAFLRRHGASEGRTHTDIAAFAADADIDIVLIASPDRLHGDQAVACLNAGKHVLVEKPMATSIADARRMADAAIAGRKGLKVGFHLRSHAGHLALKHRLHEIGSLRHIRGIWAFPQKDASGWRAGPALARWWSLAAVGAHVIDLARWFSDDFDEWAAFSSVISRDVWQGPHDETAVIAAKLKSGATVELVSSVQFGPYARFELFGDRGDAICEGTLGRKGAGDVRLNGENLSFEAAPPFVRQLREFVAAVKGDRALNETEINAGIRNTRDLLRAIECKE